MDGYGATELRRLAGRAYLARRAGWCRRDAACRGAMERLARRLFEQGRAEQARVAAAGRGSWLARLGGGGR